MTLHTLVSSSAKDLKKEGALNHAIFPGIPSIQVRLLFRLFQEWFLSIFSVDRKAASVEIFGIIFLVKHDTR